MPGTLTLLKMNFCVIRGVKVMLDADLAEIYGYEMRAFNQQVKLNIDKFDDDFRFQLTDDEFKRLMSKNLTSKTGRGGTRKLPFVFTEQGIYMLMTVLRGGLATLQSKAIIRLFKDMKERQDGTFVPGKRVLHTNFIAHLGIDFA